MDGEFSSVGNPSDANAPADPLDLQAILQLETAIQEEIKYRLVILKIMYKTLFSPNIVITVIYRKALEKNLSFLKEEIMKLKNHNK